MGGQGIDLADLGSGNPVHLMPEDPPVAHPPNEAPSKREKFVELTKTSATKMKELKPSLKTAPIVSPDQTILGGLDHDPAFKTNSLHEEIRGNEKEKRVEPLKILKSIGKGIIQPKQTFKKQATEVTAGKLSTVERSFISHKADLELVHAHDELGHVEKKISSNTSTPGSTVEGHSYDECRSRVEGLEQQRESLRAAWITNHQVFRVRVVPSRPYQAPETKDVFGDPGDGRWLEKVLQFLGRGLLFYLQDVCTMYVDEIAEPLFDVALLQNNVERLVIASAAWQSWLYDIGTIYRWEDPSRTGKWLAIYLVLWHTEHLVGFLYGYILYIVIRNRYAPTSIQAVRDSIQRAADSRSKATRFVELIDKHGAQNWLDAVIEEMGPSLELLTVDLSNYMEILVNFYEWKSPYRTFATLLFFAACLATTCFADMAFCMKLVWFVAGGTFFLLWPIASLYPQYRALVSPIRWVFWEIPTHAEWAFQYLRLHAQEKREHIIQQRIDHKATISPFTACRVPTIKVDDSDATNSSEESELSFAVAHTGSDDLRDEDIRSFRATEGLIPGRLVLSSNGVRFIKRFTGVEEWRLSWVELAMMWKARSKLAPKPKSARGQLVIQDIFGKIRRLERMHERDDAFNNIIAFSGLRWQNLLPR